MLHDDDDGDSDYGTMYLFQVTFHVHVFSFILFMYLQQIFGIQYAEI